MGGLLAIGKSGGTIDGYLASIDSFADSLATPVNNAYVAACFTTTAPSGASIAASAPIQPAPASITSGSGATGSNDLALAVSQLRGNAPIDAVYTPFVAMVGGDLNESQRMQANAQVLTYSVEDRRTSVSGVSM